MKVSRHTHINLNQINEDLFIKQNLNKIQIIRDTKQSSKHPPIYRPTNQWDYTDPSSI